MELVGWVDAWTSPYKQTEFTEERKQLLIKCIKYRHYNFTHQSHQTLPYAAPFYSDGKLCVLNKPQWDEVMDEVYKNIPIGRRLMPFDTITRKPVNNVLYEKEKYEPKEDNTNV